MDSFLKKMKHLLKKQFLIISIIILSLSCAGLAVLYLLPINNGKVYSAEIVTNSGVLEYDIKVNKNNLEIMRTYNGIMEDYGNRETLGFYLWKNHVFVRYGAYDDAVDAGTIDNFNFTYRFPIITDGDGSSSSAFEGYLWTAVLNCKLTCSLRTTAITFASVSGVFMVTGIILIACDECNKKKEQTIASENSNEETNKKLTKNKD